MLEALWQAEGHCGRLGSNVGGWAYCEDLGFWATMCGCRGSLWELGGNVTGQRICSCLKAQERGGHGSAAGHSPVVENQWIIVCVPSQGSTETAPAWEERMAYNIPTPSASAVIQVLSSLPSPEDCFNLSMSSLATRLSMISALHFLPWKPHQQFILCFYIYLFTCFLVFT